ncbi:hypothetical protein [Atlantibacter subterraneus]|uniref:hypothetical protein n=1 Tax=Atlantibacter subterraneus TaxID=255519 RepID=UPI0029656B7D|nr:hypothetical protein [Atlantibacter subterranea]MDW2743659.1 hypothetical protein [Atlantibacter subterranea]
MKLIDILVQELPKHGGWPEGVKEIEQDGCGQLIDMSQDTNYYSDFKLELCDGWEKAVVTREQYEKALAASQHPVWNGEGLPPVGCQCEIGASTPYLNIPHPEGAVVKIYSHFTDDRGVELAAFVDAAGKVGGVCTAKCFRPIRSEADKKRDEAVSTMVKFDLDRRTVGIDALYPALYDAIAAGKIPHIQIK